MSLAEKRPVLAALQLRACYGLQDRCRRKPRREYPHSRYELCLQIRVVHYAVTMPGIYGNAGALVAEVTISFVLID